MSLVTNLQVCRNINQIKICMETGRKVILLNLENLYESLYDVLNQVTKPINEHNASSVTYAVVLHSVAWEKIC